MTRAKWSDGASNNCYTSRTKQCMYSIASGGAHAVDKATFERETKNASRTAEQSHHGVADG
jgi:hypothetical protein